MCNISCMPFLNATHINIQVLGKMVHKDHSKLRTTDLALEIMSFMKAPSDPRLERIYTKHLARSAGKHIYGQRV